MKGKQKNDLIRFSAKDPTVHADANASIAPRVAVNRKKLKEVFRSDATLVIKETVTRSGVACLAAYFDGMTNAKSIYESVIEPLQAWEGSVGAADDLTKRILINGETKILRRFSDCCSALFDGDTVVFVEGCAAAVGVNTKGFPVRAVTEPEIEKSLSGPREGFNESLMMNTAMLRRKLKTADFCAERLTFGSRTNSAAFLCYLDGVAKTELLCEVRRRLDRICIDGVLDTNYLAEQIADNRTSLLKTVAYTEKPDAAAAALLEGRVVLLLDGTPVALIVPTLFIDCFHDAEDYYTNFYYASVGRILRMICFVFTVCSPAVFISLVSFQPEMIPTDLALSIARAREGVPFPVTLECFLMIAVFDILREASQRLPNSIAQTLGIVGAIVVGEAAVSARFIGATTLIVVAFSGICGLMLPKLKGAVIYYRVFLLALASLFGFYGTLFGGVVILVRMMDLKSFGVPYLSYLFSVRMRDQKDVLIRAPWWMMGTRPISIAADEVRQNEK